MKQYKILKVKVGLVDLSMDNYEKIETVMNHMAKDGWEVVCISPEPHSTTTNMLVTFCRDHA